MTNPEKAVLESVELLGISYEIVHIDPGYADTTAFCEKYGYPLDQSANTIIVASKKEPRSYAACVVLASTRLDVNRRVRKLLGVSRASFATAEEMAALTGMQVGGVTPFALPDGIPVYVDEKIMALDWVILGSGGRASKIKISPVVFKRLPNAQVISELSMAPPT